jgi:hypothetical protein
MLNEFDPQSCLDILDELLREATGAYAYAEKLILRIALEHGVVIHYDDENGKWAIRP